MHFTFGDMTKEVNVFHLGKQPRDLDDQTIELNLIKGLTSKHEEEPVGPRLQSPSFRVLMITKHM